MRKREWNYGATKYKNGLVAVIACLWQYSIVSYYSFPKCVVCVPGSNEACISNIVTDKVYLLLLLLPLNLAVKVHYANTKIYIVPC